MSFNTSNATNRPLVWTIFTLFLVLVLTLASTAVAANESNQSGLRRLESSSHCAKANCAHYEPFHVSTSVACRHKCGGYNQGGEDCKMRCCEVQQSYCNSVCALASCNSRCMNERGCPR